jgi:hypothetical protein
VQLPISTSLLASPEHSATQIHADYLHVGEAFHDSGGETVGAATDVQNPPVSWPDALKKHAMRGLEKQVLQRVAVIAAAPAVELEAGIIRAVSHAPFLILSGIRPRKAKSHPW